MYITNVLSLLLLSLVLPVLTDDVSQQSPRPRFPPGERDPSSQGQGSSARFPRNGPPPLPLPRQAPPLPDSKWEQFVRTAKRRIFGIRDLSLGPGPGKNYDEAAAREIYRKRAQERREAASRSPRPLEKRQTNLAESSTATASPTASADASNSTAIPEDPNAVVWILDDVYEGQTFFDYWNFYNYSDPTNGLVGYVDRKDALANNLAYVMRDGTVVMKADNTTTLGLGEWRKSVRIESLKTYTGGLFILDVDRTPYGCGIWPAWWTAGADWPWQGEIDVYEGVNESSNNQAAWHTAPGCKLSRNGGFSGSVLGDDCNGLINYNIGCPILDSSGSSSGSTLRNIGGGVFALKWDETGITIWFFPRSVIPPDIKSFTPDPTQWGTPSARLSPTKCDIARFFQNHKIIFNITFCGDWAGAQYAASGCQGTCEARVMDPKNFDEAVWHINYMRVYTNSRLEAGVLNAATRRAPTPATWLDALFGLGMGMVAAWFLGM